MLFSCLLFALAAAAPLTGCIMRKDSLLLSFLSVLFCCAGVAVGILTRGELPHIAAGAALVLLSALAAAERSKKS